MTYIQENTVEKNVFSLAHCPLLTLKEKYRLLEVWEETPDVSPSSSAYRAGLKSKSREAFYQHMETFHAEAEKERLNHWGILFISRNNPLFPEKLKTIYDSPLGIFCQGSTDLLEKQSLSVVGARSCTTYGKTAIKKILPEMMQQDYVIVSGLASGIDTEAHSIAVRSGGQTIAVIGTGLDIAYPAENKELQKEIGKYHLLISEYPLGTKPLKEHFPMRNRLIAGLSRGTLVVEARYRSGSLITANLALNEGREVFAVPGSILSPLSEGTNDLIKHGAKCVLSAEDILEDFSFSKW